MQNRVPIGHWKSKENQMNYMNWLSQKLDIKSMEDWYKISHRVSDKININTKLTK